MDKLSANIKNSDSQSAKKITDILYRLVDNKEIQSFKVEKISKGKNSIDLNPLVPIIDDIDFESIYRAAEKSGIITAGKAYLGLRIAREILSVVKDGIDIAERAKKKSLFGLSCKINNRQVVRYGRSFGVEPFDTIMTSATLYSLENLFLKQRKWGEIKIALDKYYLIQYIAIFVKHPVAAITHIGKVDDIQYNPKNGKSTIILDGKPKKIQPIPYDDNWPHHNAHGTVYTTLKRIERAKTLADVYPSLDKRKRK